jgi:hypothetical protein
MTVRVSYAELQRPSSIFDRERCSRLEAAIRGGFLV